MRTSQTACASGHAFTAENTIVRANGTRFCRECHRARVRRNETRRAPRCWRCRRARTACACTSLVNLDRPEPRKRIVALHRRELVLLDHATAEVVRRTPIIYGVVRRHAWRSSC